MKEMTGTYERLAQLDYISALTAVRVTIKGTTYFAYRYMQTTPVSSGRLAYARGERESVREVIHCLGQRPKCIIGRNGCFRIAGDDRDWYLAAYYEKPESSELHPDGPMFRLSPWDLPDETLIDTYARLPYRRHIMTVVE
jgi:hypothetical protein